MTHVSLQTLTWGTVSAAVVSAMLLASAGDDAAVWRFEAPAAGPRPAGDGASRRPATPSLRLARPPGPASSADVPRR